MTPHDIEKPTASWSQLSGPGSLWMAISFPHECKSWPGASLVQGLEVFRWAWKLLPALPGNGLGQGVWSSVGERFCSVWLVTCQRRRKEWEKERWRKRETENETELICSVWTLGANDLPSGADFFGCCSVFHDAQISRGQVDGLACVWRALPSFPARTPFTFFFFSSLKQNLSRAVRKREKDQRCVIPNLQASQHQHPQEIQAPVIDSTQRQTGRSVS